MLTRRHILKGSAALMGLGALSIFFKGGEVEAAGKQQWFKIGACDWSLGKESEVSAFEVAKRVGIDGVQISLGNEKNDMHLRRKEVQDAYKNIAKKLGLQIGGLAIGALNNIPYKSDPRAEKWVSDSIDVAKAMGVKVVLLAFFEKGDLKNDPQGTKVVIERLQIVAPKAEKEGVTLGIESWLSAKEHMDIIHAVGSTNVKVYYDVANSTHMGYNIYDEIRWLGNEQICEFHAKENGFLLGKGKVDFTEVRKAIDDIGYSGWIQIEGAVPDQQTFLDSYIQNARFLRSAFPEVSKG